MRTDKECGHADKSYCGGFLTDTEFVMHELDPSRSVHEYHEILDLFERAFDIAEDRHEDARTDVAKLPVR
jgi:hypothetical protein